MIGINILSFFSSCSKSGRTALIVLLALLLLFFPKIQFSISADNLDVSADAEVEVNMKEAEELVESLYQKIMEEDRLVDKLDSSFGITYPIGIQSENADLNYAIILDQDKINTAGMFISAYMRFQIPGTGKLLMFKADGIKLTSNGGFTGDANIHLIGRKKIPLIKGVDMILEGDETYVTFDCTGFKSFTLGGRIVFSPNLIKSENPVTGEPTQSKITVRFSQSMSDWNDMLFSISISPFQFATFPHFGFQVENLVFDMSDTRNTEGMIFPQRYEFSDEVNNNINLWRGIYIKSATVRIPDIQGKGNRPSLSANGMIIDDMGYTGSFSASNLIDIKSGTVGGWAFSLDNITVDMINSVLTKGALAGQICLPISKPGQGISYTALITDSGDFNFTASRPRNIDVPCFVAQMTIDASSKISISKVGKKYLAEASLNGTININTPIGKNTDSEEKTKTESNSFKVSNLRFQGLRVASAAPYFSMGTWSLNSMSYNDKTCGFEVRIDNINTIENGLEKGIEFKCTVSLMTGKYVGNTVVAVNGIMDTTKFAENNGRHRWKYSGTQVKEVAVDCNDEVISLKGYFAIYNDHAVYGDGISGTVTAKILPTTMGLQLAATAIFGNVSKMRYWYFDALVAFKNGIAIGPISIYGFGGGAYYHMKRANGDAVQLKEEKVDLTGTSIGTTASGLRYVPDAGISLGLKATIVLGLSGDPKPFNGDATLEIAFNNSGGVNTVGFLGNGYLMSDIVIGKPRGDAPLRATLDMTYDFPNKSFHAVLDVTVNAAEGLIQGSGKLEMHFDPAKWYIYVGTPQSRISVSANMLVYKVTTTAYFVIGTVLPPFAEPDPEVLGILNISYKKPTGDANLISGKGFAFGLTYSYKTPRIELAIFYAQFGIGMGFDVMLANYGSNTICVETGRTVGMNGWYAMGQAYAYVKGDIGASVKFLGKRYNKKILGIGAAVLLEATLPNPTWMKGTVGGQWELFGGMISGNCRFQVELGTKCTMQKVAAAGSASVLEGMDIISSLTPEDNRSDVDVFANPQVVYNYKIGKEFDVTDENNRTFSVRIINDYFKVTTDGADVVGDYKWNSRNDVYVFTPKEILPGNTKITISAKVHFEENKGSGWQTVYEGGSPVQQSLTATFTTGKAPDFIPESNVAYQYPLKDQLNFLKNEYNKGFVKLIKGQSYLFNPGAEWVQMAKYTPVKEGSPLFMELTYDAGNNTVNYGIPAGFANETVYKFNLANIPKSSIQIDKNITQKSQEKDVNTETKVTMKEQKAEGELSVLQEKVLLESFFRTSKYNTFIDKMAAIKIEFASTVTIAEGLDILRSNTTIPEDFDVYEAGKKVEPVITYIADSTGRWVSVYAKNIVYYKYPVIPSATIGWRNISELGLVPTKAVAFGYTTSASLTEDAKSTGIYANQNNFAFYYFKLGYYSKQDYREIFRKLMNCGRSNSDIRTYIYSDYPEYPYVVYPLTCKYVLPNKVVTSTTTISMPRL